MKTLNLTFLVIVASAYFTPFSAQNYSECQGPAAHMNPACNADDKITYPKKEKGENTALKEKISAEEITIKGVAVNASYDQKKPKMVSLSAENNTSKTKTIRGEVALSSHTEDRLAGRCNFSIKVPAKKKVQKNLRCKIEGPVGHMLISED